MKYIMLKVITAGVERYLPVIFPDALVHRDVALAMRRVDGAKKAEVLSTGMCRIDATCFDKSESLGVASHPKDELIIDTWDQLRGIGIRDADTDVGYPPAAL